MRLTDLAADAVLLGLEQVERDGVSQVGAKELVPLIFEAVDSAPLTLGFAFALLAVPLQVSAKVVMEGCQFLDWYLRPAVQLGNLLLDDLDGQVLEVTAVALVAPEAEEVEVLTLRQGEAEP